MLRDRRLTHSSNFRQLPYGVRPVPQSLEESPPRWIGKGGECRTIGHSLYRLLPIDMSSGRRVPAGEDLESVKRAIQGALWRRRSQRRPESLHAMLEVGLINCRGELCVVETHHTRLT